MNAPPPLSRVDPAIRSVDLTKENPRDFWAIENSGLELALSERRQLPTNEAATGFRELLAKANPTFDDLNRHYAFWKGLRSVLAETERRTQAQGAGLISGVTGGAGVIGGLMSGEDVPDKLQNALL